MCCIYLDLCTIREHKRTRPEFCVQGFRYLFKFFIGESVPFQLLVKIGGCCSDSLCKCGLTDPFISYRHFDFLFFSHIYYPFAFRSNLTLLRGLSSCIIALRFSNVKHSLNVIYRKIKNFHEMINFMLDNVKHLLYNVITR